MKFRRFLYSGDVSDWQFNIGKWQFNWTGHSKDYPKLPWGMVMWYNGKHLHSFTRRYR